MFLNNSMNQKNLSKKDRYIFVYQMLVVVVVVVVVVVSDGCYYDYLQLLLYFLLHLSFALTF